MSANRIHSTVTYVTDAGWGWGCETCPAKADGYGSKTKALRVASIHEDPSRKQQGSTAAATRK